MANNIVEKMPCGHRVAGSLVLEELRSVSIKARRRRPGTMASLQFEAWVDA
jgi:hypothetical protein